MLDENPIRIALVDDNPHDRALVRRELQREFPNVEILEAANEADLNALLAERPLSLVITDFQLQELNGIEVLRLVRARDAKCPVIMFTATGNEEVAVDAMKEGLDDYVVKNVQRLLRLRASVRNVLQQAATASRAERHEHRLRDLLGRLKIGVFRCNSAGELLEANQAFRRILRIDHPEGLPASEAFTPPARPDVDPHADPHADPAGHTTPVRLREFFADPTACDKLLEHLAQCTDSYEVEVCLAARNEEFWVSLNLTRSASPDEEHIFEGLVEDITARKRLEDAERANQTEMAHASRLMTIGEMVAGLAHEINQPLSAIANYALAAIKTVERSELDDLSQAAGLKKWMTQIRDQADRAAEIIRRTRRFVRRHESRRSEAKINEIVEEAVALVDFEARRSGISIRCNLPDPSPTAEVDRIQVQQVLVNLLRNAFDAIGSDCEDRTTEIDVVPSPDHVAICVRDPGCGISDEHLDQIFEPFMTTKSEGMGMGLAISKSLIEAHGGRLTAANNATGGATFQFSLPLIDNSSVSMREHSTHP